jgi:hypothetical protein
MTLQEFHDQVVLPNVADFNANFSSLRHAFNAIAAVDALAAHIYKWCEMNAITHICGINNDNAYRHELAKRNRDFELLRDIAKLQKHVHLKFGEPLVTRAEQMTARPIGYGEGGYGEGRIGGEAQVVVDVNPGEIYYVGAIVDRALAFLEGEMKYLADCFTPRISSEAAARLTRTEP